MNKILNKTLFDFLNEMEDSRKNVLLQIYKKHNDLFHYAAGSGHNHQAWQGGYADHIAEILRINEITYTALLNIRPLDFSKDSATIALFFHDIEKPFRYGPAGDARCDKWRKKFTTPNEWEKAKWMILDEMREEFNFSFTEDEINALTYTHGEGHDHRKDKRVSSPLAAHVHHCDNASARIWPNAGQGLG
jgi:hypothetical protein